MQESAKKKLIKAALPSGFRDYGPEDAIWKGNAIEKIRTIFERFGFDPIETPAVERTEVLTGGEAESGKIIFNVKGSREKDTDESKMSLRFDLTVPLARFLTANIDIPKPFKRYQIGEVFRGESPQAGRYREFTQVDADIVGTGTREAEVEIFQLLQDVFLALGVKDYKIKINNRKILNSLPEFAGFSQERLWDALRIIDKKDKIGISEVAKELEKEFDGNIAQKIMEFLKKDTSKINDLMIKGESELDELINMLTKLGIKNWEVDLSLVRGLSYYTGVIYEVILTYIPEVGSIAGGGRYDNLLRTFTGQPIPAIGVTIGIDRLFAGLEKLGQIQKKATNTQVLVLMLSPALKKEYFLLTEELRKEKINTALYLGEDLAFQAQLTYAVKKEIPYIVIMGEEEAKKGTISVKNLTTREQKEIPRMELVKYFKK